MQRAKLPCLVCLGHGHPRSPSSALAQGHAANRIRIQIRRAKLTDQTAESPGPNRRFEQPPAGEDHVVPHSTYLPERMGRDGGLERHRPARRRQHPANNPDALRALHLGHQGQRLSAPDHHRFGHRPCSSAADDHNGEAIETRAAREQPTPGRCTDRNGPVTVWQPLLLTSGFILDNRFHQ